LVLLINYTAYNYYNASWALSAFSGLASLIFGGIFLAIGFGLIIYGYQQNN